MGMNDYLSFGATSTPPSVRRPDHCNKTCIHFSGCNFPKSCPILEKDRREAVQMEKEMR